MPNDALPAALPPPRPAIAHWTHTAALLAVLAITAIAGHARVESAAYLDSSRIPRYTASIITEWLLLGAVIAGIYVRRNFFAAAIFKRIPGVAQTLGLGLAVYITTAVVIGVVRGLLTLTRIPHEVNLQVILAMAPHSALEFMLWTLLSLTAGICEELVFRGYLLQQLSAWTRSPITAIVLTGLLFGSVHAYEGLGAILPLAALGIIYGVVVRYTQGDLRPVIVAHFLQDFLLAFLVPALKHLPIKP